MQAEDEIESLLDAIHHAVRNADFATLGAILPRFEACAGTRSSRHDAPTLRRLQAKAQRNAELLVAAGRGVRAARQRLQEILAGGRGLVTYDGKGQRADPGPEPTVGRRV